MFTPINELLIERLGEAVFSDWVLLSAHIRRRVSVCEALNTATELRKYSVPPALSS